MTRRTAVRRPRRVSVRFWKQGETTIFSGHTTNISTTGMFLATNSPAPSGARVRIEVVERERGFVVEGVVVHARKVRPELARITESGMGIRFLTVEDLVGELLPGAGGLHDDTHGGAVGAYTPAEAPPASAPPASAPPASAPQAAAPPERAPASNPFPPAGPPSSSPFPPPAARAPLPAPVPFPAPALRPGTAPVPITDIPAPRPVAEAPPPVSSPSTAVPVGGIGTFAVRFGTPAEFLEVYRRDILNGGLFVSTRFPARLQETVVVQLHPPVPGAEPISLRARVVQRFEPQSGDHSPNLLSGMGLELMDLPTIVEKMLPVIAQLVGDSNRAC